MTPDDDILIEKLEEEPDPKKIDIQKELSHYRHVLAFMGANVPIEVLCLPKAVITILHKNDIIRVYDLIDHSLDGIKGLGEERIDLIRARCDDFFSVTL
jgi:hypothetical protein